MLGAIGRDYSTLLSDASSGHGTDLKALSDMAGVASAKLQVAATR